MMRRNDNKIIDKTVVKRSVENGRNAYILEYDYYYHTEGAKFKSHETVRMENTYIRVFNDYLIQFVYKPTGRIVEYVPKDAVVNIQDVKSWYYDRDPDTLQFFPENERMNRHWIITAMPFSAPKGDYDSKKYAKNTKILRELMCKHYFAIDVQEVSVNIMGFKTYSESLYKRILELVDDTLLFVHEKTEGDVIWTNGYCRSTGRIGDDIRW